METGYGLRDGETEGRGRVTENFVVVWRDETIERGGGSGEGGRQMSAGLLQERVGLNYLLIWAGNVQRYSSSRDIFSHQEVRDIFLPVRSAASVLVQLGGLGRRLACVAGSPSTLRITSPLLSWCELYAGPPMVVLSMVTPHSNMPICKEEMAGKRRVTPTSNICLMQIKE
jgi:hypothetical protein